MTSGQKAGVVLTIVADALWLVVVVAILATPPDAGANIGAGVLGLLALPLSIVAAAVLITAAHSTAPRVASAASIALWALSVAFSWTFVGLAAILALSTSAVLVGMAHRRQRR
jgi:membrane protease YdiL (CAAX protease family)